MLTPLQISLLAATLFAFADLVLFCIYARPNDPFRKQILPGSGFYFCWREYFA